MKKEPTEITPHRFRVFASSLQYLNNLKFIIKQKLIVFLNLAESPGVTPDYMDLESMRSFRATLHV